MSLERKLADKRFALVQLAEKLGNISGTRPYAMQPKPVQAPGE